MFADEPVFAMMRPPGNSGGFGRLASFSEFVANDGIHELTHANLAAALQARQRSPAPSRLSTTGCSPSCRSRASSGSA
jgi:hypothetical protein